MIELCDLSFSYGAHVVLQKINCTISPGKMTFLLGQNGAGKSTLFRCILGQLPLQSGDVLVHNRSIRQYSIQELAKQISYVPQASTPVFSYPVEQVVLMGRSAYTSFFSSPTKADEEIVQQALQCLGISHLSKQGFSNISGGEQQLVLIARALAQHGQVLLMDEPTASLDYGNQLKVLIQIKKLCTQGFSVLLSSHNPQHALWFADEIIALAHGRILAQGSAAEVLTPELMYNLYHVGVRFASDQGTHVIIPKF